MRLLPNSMDFPILVDVLGDVPDDGMDVDDLQVFMTGIFASAGKTSSPHQLPPATRSLCSSNVQLETSSLTTTVPLSLQRPLFHILLISSF
jgi:hypothetical protein